MINENIAVFRELGITKWHEKGYTGKGTKAITYERFNPIKSIQGKVLPLFTDKYPITTTEYNNFHGNMTSLVFLEVAPNATIYQVVDSENNFQALKESTIPWIKENKPIVGFRSIIDTMWSGFDTIYDSEIMKFCKLFNGAGNSGITKYTKRIADECFFGVGAVDMKVGQSSFSYAGYSSVSEYVDCCGVSGIYVPYGSPTYFDKTSCATPMIAGMCALVDEFFISKIGRPLTHDEFKIFLYNNCVDIEENGKDNKTGYGYFVLPDPDSIDIVKYTGQNGSDDTMELDNEFKTWSKEAGEWAIANGIIFGDENGNYKLSEPCTREQMIVFLHRLYKLVQGM